MSFFCVALYASQSLVYSVGDELAELERETAAAETSEKLRVTNERLILLQRQVCPKKSNYIKSR